MRRLGNKVEARNLASAAGVPVMPATPPLPADDAGVLAMARAVGFPVMLKASWGGGGRGMRVVEDDRELIETVAAARREAKAAFGKDEVYLEKLIRRARHVEVQILGDSHGNLVHLYERDCTVQRRNQKVVERAPAAFLTESQRSDLCEAALKIGRAVGYRAAGTVEFLQDADTGSFYFIEVNPRIQVEHTRDRMRDRHRSGQGANQDRRRRTHRHCGERGAAAGGNSGQCARPAMPVTTEDPENNFVPDYGRVTAYRSPAGFGIRLDAGTAYAGPSSRVLRFPAGQGHGVVADARGDHFAHASGAVGVRIRGVVTNPALPRSAHHASAVRVGRLHHSIHRSDSGIVRSPRKRDRATRLLSFIGDVIVNGNPEVKERARPKQPVFPRLPRTALPAPPAGTKQKLDQLGPEKFADWMLQSPASSSPTRACATRISPLLATRFRTHDMASIAPFYAALLPQLFSVECWGGATFDVAMRFLREDPWARLAAFREAMPNLLLQMLFRSANAVGYTNYPDNVVKALRRPGG